MRRERDKAVNRRLSGGRYFVGLKQGKIREEENEESGRGEGVKQIV